MAIDVPTFKASYPEFEAAPKELIQAKLDFAARLVPVLTWGALQQDGAFLYCARFLALSPFGRKLAIVNKQGQTIYDEDLNRLKRMVTSGSRVL